MKLYHELAEIEQSKSGRAGKRNWAYLKHGILKPTISDEDLRQILLSSPAEKMLPLISAIRRWNPPGDDRLDQLTAVYGATTTMLMMFRIMRENHLLPELDRFLADPGADPEAQHAANDIESHLKGFEYLFNIEQVAQTRGFSFQPVEVPGEESNEIPIDGGIEREEVLDKIISQSE
jgi:hypothetical protein